MSKGTVLLLMSGGVDSSVAGALLLEQGYDVVGVTMMQLRSVDPSGEEGGCCSQKDIRDAKHAAETLGIPHCSIDTAKNFHENVIVPFIRSYENGLTPNPCVHCNSFVRFEEAFGLALEWDYQFAATGHYARIEQDETGAPRLYRANYREKDQSYFLYGIPKHLLQKILFPLGDKKKEEVRAIASHLGLVTADKPESQDICFTLGRPYTEFLAERIPSQEGPILDQKGTVLGTHRGVIHYTVGQRRGLGLSGGPFYVCAIDPKRNTVIVGKWEELGKRIVNTFDSRWIHEPQTGDEVLGQIRSRHVPALGIITRIQEGGFTLEFNEPQYGVAPGQALVVSKGDEILGGGTIQPYLETRN